MQPHLSLLPSDATPDAVPLTALRVHRPVVLHEVRTVSPATALTASHELRCNDNTRPHLVTQRDESGRRVIAVLETGTAPTPIGRVSPSRRVRAAMETLPPVAESMADLFHRRPRHMATFARPWITRHPGDKEPAGASVSIAVSSDGDSFMERTAYVVQPGASEVNPSPLMTGRAIRPLPVISIIAPQSSGRLISQPRKESNGVSQVESRTYRIATAVGSARRRHLRIASRDGVIDAEENALTNELLAIEEELEAKADDERAGLALIRTGRTKHTRGIVVDLFPQIGPEAA